MDEDVGVERSLRISIPQSSEVLRIQLGVSSHFAVRFAGKLL